MAGTWLFCSLVEQTITSGPEGARLLVCRQAHWGASRPVWTFVMNTRAEINEAFRDYRATSSGMVMAA